jgi:hypothetical protein
MSRYSNLAPGSLVPVPGKYRCEFCGSGGWADTIAQKYRETQRITLDEMEKLANKGSTVELGEGEKFPECPQCGAGALWTLVQYKGDDPDVLNELAR